jgi:integrase
MRATATLYILPNSNGTRERLEFKKTKNSRGVESAVPQPQLPIGYEGKFYLRTSINGKRVWQSYETIDLALAARDQFVVTHDRKKQGLPSINPTEAVKNILAPSYAKGTIAAAVEEFIRYSESRIEDWRKGADNGLAPNSVVAYKKAMKDFAASCVQFGATEMSEFQNGERGKAILMHFKKWLGSNINRRAGKAGHGDARKFVILDTFLARNGVKLSKDRKFNPNDPGFLDYRDVPRVKKGRISDVVFYTPADLRAMLKATESFDKEKSIYDADDLKELMLTFLLTGCRDEEIQHLTWASINWKNGDGRGKITIQDQPAYDWRVKDHEKRMVVMPDELRNWLQARRARTSKHEELVFPNSVGRPNQNFADHIAGLQKRAIKSDYTFSRPECQKHILHNFRKTYATMEMLIHGATPREIQADLGHSELATTEHYLADTREDRERVKVEYAKLLKDYSKPKKVGTILSTT